MGGGDQQQQQEPIDKNSELAKNLKGHLLLSTGDIDNNVHPSNTIAWDALIRVNKRFDMIVLRGQRHDYRRRRGLLPLDASPLLL